MLRARRGLPKQQQEEELRDEVERALDSERYIVFAFRVEPDVPFNRFVPFYSMRGFPDGDYPKARRFIEEAIADILKPHKESANGDGQLDDNDAALRAARADTEGGDGQSKPEE